MYTTRSLAKFFVAEWVAFFGVAIENAQAHKANHVRRPWPPSAASYRPPLDNNGPYSHWQRTWDGYWNPVCFKYGWVIL